MLRKAVQDHAQHEEREEFPRLRSSLNPVQLEAMGVAVRVAEVMAPTHPHPEVNSLAANLMAGPMLALVDRTRDLVRDAVQRSRPVGLDAAEEAPRQHTRTRPEWRQVGMGDLHKGAQRGRDRKPDRRALEERSVKELRERARELQLPGRSSMRKDELIGALRKQPK